MSASRLAAERCCPFQSNGCAITSTRRRPTPPRLQGASGFSTTIRRRQRAPGPAPRTPPSGSSMAPPAPLWSAQPEPSAASSGAPVPAPTAIRTQSSRRRTAGTVAGREALRNPDRDERLAVACTIPAAKNAPKKGPARAHRRGSLPMRHGLTPFLHGHSTSVVRVRIRRCFRVSVFTAQKPDQETTQHHALLEFAEAATNRCWPTSFGVEWDCRGLVVTRTSTAQFKLQARNGRAVAADSRPGFKTRQ
jgi:hypothetical protein